MKRPADARARKDLLLQVSAVVLFVVAWHAFTLTETARLAEMPTPVGTFTAFVELLGTEPYWTAFGVTVFTWALALGLSVLIGIPVGLVIGRNRRVFDSTKVVVDFLRTLPALALIPLGLLLFRASVTMAVLIGLITAVWPLIVQATAAGQHADPVLHRVARSFRLTGRDRFSYVLAPDAIAFIWPGLRLAVTASLLSTIAAQLIGGAPGLGRAILDAQVANRTDELYAYVLTACLLGLAINGMLLVLQRRLLWWHPSMRGTL